MKNFKLKESFFLFLFLIFVGFFLFQAIKIKNKVKKLEEAVLKIDYKTRSLAVEMAVVKVLAQPHKNEKKRVLSKEEIQEIVSNATVAYEKSKQEKVDLNDY